MSTKKVDTKRRSKKVLAFDEIEPRLRKIATTARSKELRIIARVVRVLWRNETAD